MLSKEENELLCRTGPRTPMGRVVPAGVIALRHRLLKGARDLQAGQEPSEPHCGGAYRVHPSASLRHREISFNELARSAMPRKTRLSALGLLCEPA
jgi:hypothetical protein